MTLRAQVGEAEVAVCSREHSGVPKFKSLFEKNLSFKPQDYQKAKLRSEVGFKLRTLLS